MFRTIELRGPGTLIAETEIEETRLFWHIYIIGGISIGGVSPLGLSPGWAYEKHNWIFTLKRTLLQTFWWLKHTVIIFHSKWG